MFLTRSRLVCNASSSTTGTKKSWVNRFAAKRSSAAKENLSRLTMIGAAEIKEVMDALNELDTIHKNAFKEMTQKMNEKPVSTEVTETPVEQPGSIFVDDE